MKTLRELRATLEAAGAIPLDVGRDGDDGCAFSIGTLRVLASWGGGWDHVSVSAGWGHQGATRVPTYGELESVRRMFFQDNETVVQIHPPLRQYVNCHPYVLHLWRPQGVELPLPPQEYIA